MAEIEAEQQRKQEEERKRQDEIAKQQMLAGTETKPTSETGERFCSQDSSSLSDHNKFGRLFCVFFFHSLTDPLLHASRLP